MGTINPTISGEIKAKKPPVRQVCGEGHWSTPAVGHLNSATPTHAPPLLTRCPHLAPQSPQAGAGHSRDRLASPGPWLSAITCHPRPCPETSRPRRPQSLTFCPESAGFAPDAVGGEEAALEHVFEHLAGGLLQPRRNRPKYGHQLEKAKQGAGWSKWGSWGPWPPDQRPQIAGLGHGTLSPWTYAPKKTKPPQHTETHSNCRQHRTPLLKWRRLASAAKRWILHSPEPPLRGQAQSRHGDHGLPVPFALKPALVPPPWKRTPLPRDYFPIVVPEPLLESGRMQDNRMG